jgi:dolichol-phosphate mannosyltransferase
MHRFLPALFQRAGARVVSVAVRHRPRERGTSKYGLFDRLWVGIVDIFGVMWLKRRYVPGLQVQEDRISG